MVSIKPTCRIDGQECDFQIKFQQVFGQGGESMSREYQCEFEGVNHYGEVLRVKPDGWFTREKHICQGHLFYICWDYTILIHVDGRERVLTGVLGKILKLYKEIVKEQDHDRRD